MKIKIGYLLAPALVVGLLATSCTEEIDTSNRYTFTGQTCTDYIASKPEFSEYYKMISNTYISARSKSTLAQLLSIRGYFSVFPPTNDAIKAYLAKNAEAGIIPEGYETIDQLREIGDAQITHKADSLNDIIVRNSIIDRSRDGKSFWYINDMITLTNNSGEVSAANMNNRYLAVVDSGVKEFVIDDVTVQKQMYYVQNEPVRNPDIEVFNGVIQEMDGVVAPTNDNVFDILDQDRFSVMSKLIHLTGWDKVLSDQDYAFTDRKYNDLYLSEGENLSPQSKQTTSGRWYQVSIAGGNNNNAYFPERRDLGFTIFAETDDVYKKMGINVNDEEGIDKLMNYLSGEMSGAVVDHNFTDSTNILNQFVSYHILPFRATYDQLVVHYNELGCGGPGNKQNRIGMMVSEYYETLGWPRRLIKLSEGISTNGMRLNRISKVHRENAKEERDLQDVGIKIWQNGDTINQPMNPSNGWVYPIDSLLVYSDKFKEALGRERIRFDVTAALPEMITNKLRRPISGGDYVSFPNSYPYLTRMWVNDESIVCYLPGTNSSWANVQGDEFNINGQYEVTLQLPPVPKTGTYEIRYGVSASGRRGMCQVYFGDNRNAMPAAGIPLDLRLRANTYGWVKDQKGEDAANNEVDKKLRNNTFMKAPASYSFSYMGANYDQYASNVLRNTNSYSGQGDGAIIRRIVVRQHMEEGKVYYIKFKDVLGRKDSEFFFDYLELCPKSVYDNPSLPEDIW